MRVYPRAFFLDGYNLAITWSISNCTLIAQPACNYGERKFRFFFSHFSFRFFFCIFFDPPLGFRSCGEKCSNASSYITRRGGGEKKLAIRGSRGWVPILPIINLVSVGREADPRAKRSFIRASVPRIVALLSSSRYKNVPRVPSLAVTLCEPCVAERIKNTAFFLSLPFFSRFWFTCTDPGAPLPSFFPFFYTEKNGSINGIGG